MDYIDFEESLHLLPPRYQLLPPLVLSQPFPFLDLPREIRDSIYHYALLYEWAGPSVTPNRCYFNRHEKPFNPLMQPAAYWGTEVSTRLFRVNRQVSHEALELFYSTYFFRIPDSISLLRATVRDTLTPWARSLIRNISFFMNLLCSHRTAFTPAGEEKRRQVFEAAVNLLPNVKRVELRLSFIGLTVPDYQVKELVAIALRTASPLKDCTGLVLLGNTNQTAQRTRIFKEVREALGCLSEERV